MEPIKFLHLADLHLGKRQYNLKERYKDYFRVFTWMLALSVKEEVDFILIAGDIFDSKNIDPSVLTKVFYRIRDFKEECKKQLKRDIPIICIEGNHDNPVYKKRSWMTFLADLKLIILLSGKYDTDTKTFTFDSYSKKKANRGGKIEVKKDTYIYGVSYFGSFTQHIFTALKNAIPKDDSKFNILMMHFGLEGQDPGSNKPGVKKETRTLKELHDSINYLALGHYHKQYVFPSKDPWIFNPGSLELNDLRELSYTRGAFLATISGKEYYRKDIKSLTCDNGNTDPNLIPNRKFFPISSIDISMTNSFEESTQFVLTTLKKWGVPLQNSKTKIKPSDLSCPIIFFALQGEVGYSRLEINTNKLRQEILKTFSVLDVRINSKNLFSTLDQIKAAKEATTIDEIEQSVFVALINESPQYKHIRDDVLHLLTDVKSELLQKKPNYSNLREKFAEWSVKNVKDFKTPPERVIDVPEDSKAKEVEEAKEAKEAEVLKRKKDIQALIEKKQKALAKTKDKPEKGESEPGLGLYDDYEGIDENIDDGDD